ncbi:MAG: GNAT family N-acetyltransferase [Eubacteriales bacterium]|jgi:ribosomal protein S18 acetylase RimI-like enzyme|nr:GNAT family N-acetyltransferase [Eubacteriales bacterium]
MVKTAVLVKKATIYDIEGIMKVTREAFEKYAQLAGLPCVDALTETYEQVKSDIENKLVYIAITEGQIVGSVRVAVDEESKTAYLSRFGVSVSQQNAGVGKALMQSVDEDMYAMGVQKLFLHTASKISSLISFYYNRGFYIESTSTEKGYVRALLVKEYF